MPTLQKIIDLIGTQRPIITLLSAIVASIFALIFLLPIWKYKPVMVSRWGRAFGWGFFALAGRYAVAFGEWLFQGRFPNLPSLDSNLSLIASILFAVLSGVSNLLFLQTASYLLGENRIRRSSQFRRLKLSTSVTRAIVVIVFFSVAFLGLYSQSWLARLPDAFISAFSVFIAGYAMYVNISVRRDYLVAQTALVIAVLYASVQIVYGFNPLFAELGLLGKLTNNSFEAQLSALDSIIFAVALPLKFGTFFPAYFLLLLIISSVRDIQHLLKQIADGRREFLEHEGLVKAIANSIKADQVSLLIKLPGDERNRIARFHSPHKADDPLRSHDSAKKPEIVPLISLEDSARTILTTGRNFVSAQAIGCPVIFHGAVIGCLGATLEKNKFSETDLSELKDMAAFVSPAVYAYRELASIDQLAYRFGRLQFENRFLSAEQAVSSIVDILQDTLSPLKVEVCWDIGFKSTQSVAVRRGMPNTADGVEDRQVIDQALLPISNDLLLTLRKAVEWKPESDVTGNKIYYVLAGKLTFYVSATADELSYPTLVTNYLHRRTISNVTADGVLDLARDYLNSVLKDFGVAPKSNFDSWCQAIDKTAKAAGLLWTVITSSSTKEIRFTSSAEATAIVSRLENVKDIAESNKPLDCCVLKPPAANTHHVIRVQLLDTKLHLWFGVQRCGFGEELNFASPWHVFLTQFAEVADATLLRVTAYVELKRFQIEAMKQQGLAKSAINANVLTHDLKALIGVILKTISALDDAVKTGRLSASERYAEMIAGSKLHAENVLEMTKAITSETKLDDHRPCSLLRAAKLIETLYSSSFSQENIEVSIDLNEDYMADVPFYVATLTLMNLVVNARNAIVEKHGSPADVKGIIRIDGKKDGEVIVFRVSDNGPGVPSHLVERIFEVGFSTDPDSGGWGLHLIQSHLEDNNSAVRLLPDSPAGATFEIRFPVAGN